MPDFPLQFVLYLLIYILNLFNIKSLCKLENEILKEAENAKKMTVFGLKSDFPAFLAIFKISISCLHNPYYNGLVWTNP